MIEIDWHAYLNVHYPWLAKVYLSPKEMQAVNSQLTIRNDHLLSSAPEGYETTFYDLFARVINTEIGTERERISSASLLRSLNETVGDFFTLAGNNAKLLSDFKKQMDGIFRVNGAKYLDKVGELYSTVNLMRKFSNYLLISLEYKFEENEGGSKKRS